MRRLVGVLGIALLLGLMVIAAYPISVSAHEKENFVDWRVAYDNVEFLAPPVFTHMTTLTSEGTAYKGEADQGGNYQTINMATGEYLRVDYSFRYIGGQERRGDLFWVTRLGLDFGTVGRYVNDEWIGGGSFLLVDGREYDASLLLRSLQPNLRHLHVGISISDVGNIPAAPKVEPIPEGGPTLYGIFTDAQGAVVEPLQGVNVQPFGQLKLLEPWPWAVSGLVAQIVIGIAFIAVMYWYGKWVQRRVGGAA